MKQLMKKGLSLLLVMVLLLSLLPGISLTADAATVTYRTSSNGYLYNWGTRGTTATFLSPNAESFYQKYNVTLEGLAALSGSSNLSTVQSSALYQKLCQLMSDAHDYETSYNATRSMYQYTDCQNNALNTTAISCFYTGKSIGPSWDSGSTWNREHTWPNSKSSDMNNENDIMMLRPTSSSVNSSRGNKAYGKSSGYYDPNVPSKSQYDLHGDVARIILYVYVRWGKENSSLQGNLWGSEGVFESKELLLQWMEEDPVDTWEMGRNDSVESITGTRNVFVDYPELAFLLFNASVPEMETPSQSGGNITPNTGITITSQPANVTVQEGGTAKFTVAASGTGLTYQWQYRALSTDAWATSPATGNKTATLSIPGTAWRSGYQYRCAVTNSSGNTVYTDVATLTVTAAVVDSVKITSQPASVTVPENDAAVFTVAAEGEGLTYQWQFRTSSTGSWATSPAEGNTTASVTVPGTAWRSGYQYRCAVTDSSGNTVYSDAATLTVTVAFAITSHPVSCQTTEGTDAFFTVTAVSSSLTYQWQYRTSETDTWKATPATGSKTATLTIPGTLSRNGYQYRCAITDGAGNVHYSDAATLTVQKNWENAVSGWSLTLGDDIGVNFSLSMTEEEAAEAVVRFTVNGETTDGAVAPDASGNYIVSANVAAAQMNDSITVTINGMELAKQYSVREYAEYILDEANGYDAATRTLVTEMLHYGAAAQTLFGYNTENPANTGYADTTANAVPADEQEVLVSGGAEGISFYAASMVHRSKNAVRYYFDVTGNVSDYTFQAGENVYTPELKNDLYFVEIAEIAPDALDESITLTVTTADGGVLTVSYGPMNYITRQYRKTEDANLKALLQQLYDYYLAAEAFVAQ